MFRPHHGKCVNGCSGIIVVKAGYCGPCNEKNKHSRKNGALLRPSGLPISSVADTQDIEGYTTIQRTPAKKKDNKKRRIGTNEIRQKVDFGINRSGLQGITKEHTLVYMSSLSYTIADFIACECCGLRANDIHHIFCRGMGGTKVKEHNSIENLMALCRDHHLEYGDKQQYYDALIDKHFEFLSNNGVAYDKDFFDNFEQ